MAKKPIKKMPTLSVIRKMQTKTIWDTIMYQIRVKIPNIKCWQDVVKVEFSWIADGNREYNHFGK